MTIVRTIGWILLVPAILLLSYGIVLWFDGVPVFQLVASDFLALAGSAGPDPVQAVAQRYLSGELADPHATKFLLWPVAGAIGFVAGLLSVPGVVILVLFRRGWSRVLVRRQYSR